MNRQQSDYVRWECHI